MRRLLIMSLLALLAGCTPGDRTLPTEAGTVPPEGRTGRADSVIDGDSLRVVIEGVSTEIRLIGVDAPEAGECWSDEARRALDIATADRRLVVDGTERDRFGRLLAFVYDGAVNVNEKMLLHGHAIALTSEHPLRAEFLAAEEDAAALGRGLWSAEPCGAAVDHAVVIWAIEPDAPGRDDDNPNGEWVAITNEGDPIALTGWTIRDESSTHRFTFPAGFVLDSRDIVTVRSGCGADTPDQLFWCAETPVWNNSGDTVLLLEPSGAVADRRRYLRD